MNKWNSIAPGVPNIAPKGSNSEISSAFTTYSASDPDCWWSYKQCTTPKIPGIPADIAFVPEPNTLGYGFDDGPNCSHNAFYDYLQSQNQKATMYFIGSSVMIWPLEAQRALADGHEICVHTWSHRYMTSFQSQDAFAELWYTMQAIKLATGVTPTCWRPPMGDVDDRIRYIANALGLQTIIWQHDSFDWELGQTVNGAVITQQDVENNYMTFINQAATGQFAQQGAIILTHELNNFTMSEAVKFYPQLKGAFQHIVPVGVALNKSKPYQEAGYSLPSFQQYISGTTSVNNPAPSAGSLPATTGFTASPTLQTGASTVGNTAAPSGPTTTEQSQTNSPSSALRIQSCSNWLTLVIVFALALVFS